MRPPPSNPVPALPRLAAALAAVAGLTACRTLEREPGAGTVSGAIDQPTFATIDRDGDGGVSPREMAAFQHHEGLAEIDLDNDRRISAAEWQASHPSLAGADTPLFDRLDQNRDGFLTEDEALADLLAQPVYRGAFQAMDTNRDGRLHWEEYAAGDPATLNVTLGAPAAAGS